MRWKPNSLSGARIARIDAGRPTSSGGRRPNQAGSGSAPTAFPCRCQRSTSSEIRNWRGQFVDAVTWAVPDVVDDFPQEIPITRRELEVIETYLGALLDEALEGPE